MFLKHGMARSKGRRTPEYRAWEGMKRRCKETKTKDSKNYRERGITVCDRWLNSFEEFLKDVGMRPGPGYTIDRKNNNTGYEPGNVRWATHVEQNNNRRSCSTYEFRGEKMTISQWARRLDIKVSCLRMRLSSGKSVEEAFTKPVDQTKRATSKSRSGSLS